MSRADGINLDVGPTDGRPQRIVVAVAGPIKHRDHIDTNSSLSRKRFIIALAEKLGTEVAELAALDARLVTAADEADAAVEARRAEHGTDPDDGPRKSQATRLIELAHELGAELFHDPAGDGFATLPVAEHHETHRLRSKALRQWLGRTHHRQAGTAPGAQALADAINVLEGQALFEGAEQAVYVRLAGHDGKIYLDLADPGWHVVAIDAHGWRIIDDPPIKFRRAKAMLPLPMPERGGAIADLRRLVNVGDDHWPLVVAWLVAALRPTGPYPVLCLHAEQGSGKSTVAKMLRSLSDPNTAPLRSAPRDPRDMMIAATNGWLVCLDNLSYVPPWLSDCLCRLSTGGGFSTRTLYENDEETIFDATRPVLLTGIEELATRGDLIDRALIVHLPKIPPESCRPEKVLWHEYGQARPKLLGAILDAVAAALRNLPTTHLSALPRMADFALWATAAEPALGLARGEFIGAYTANRESANDLVLESSPVVPAIRELAESCSCWSDTPAELLGELDRRADDRTKRLRGWPTSPRALSGALKRLAPNLRAIGIEVTASRSKKSRLVTITRTDPELIVTCVTTVTGPDSCTVQGDASTPAGDANGAPGDATDPWNDAGDAGDANSQPRSNGQSFTDDANAALADAAPCDEWGEL